ncbi:MAG TPA: hypothetical protein VHT91_07625 [Kofleriaceae bacterium]|nr:hypothetical protein [Kofleriaceae bacterium]
MLIGLCGAGTARADDAATLVIDGGQGSFDRVLPAGVPVKILVPVPQADPSRGKLTLYPMLPGSKACADPGPDRTRQWHEYGMAVTALGDTRQLEATISPLQIATTYCITVRYEHGLSGDQLATLADLMGATPIDWEASCTSLVIDPDHAAPRRRVDREPAQQIAVVREAVLKQLTGSLHKLRELRAASDGAPPDPARVAEAAATLTELLDVPARCSALAARLGDEDRALDEQQRATARQAQAAAAVKTLPTELRAWPIAVVLTDNAPAVKTLLELVSQSASLPAIAAQVELADPELASDLRDLAAASGDPARLAAVMAKLRAPPPRPIPLVLFVPSLSRSVRVADLGRAGELGGLLVDLAKTRGPLLRQLAVVRQGAIAVDRPIAERWSAALTGLADQAEFAVAARAHYTETKQARADAEEANRKALKDLVRTETMKGQLRRSEAVSEAPVTASRETDDKASWIAPAVGVMVAAPYLAAERRFADPWLTPYLGASVYFTRVDRVIDVDDLVGPSWRLFRQRNSVSVGLLLSTPSVRGKAVSGPWQADVVPFLGIGHRFTQYLRGDLGAILFQYNDRIPVITQPHWGVAGWAGVSLDADVWAVVGGKLGR